MVAVIDWRLGSAPLAHVLEDGLYSRGQGTDACHVDGGMLEWPLRDILVGSAVGEVVHPWSLDEILHGGGPWPLDVVLQWKNRGN